MAVLNRSIKLKTYNAIVSTPSFLGKYEEYDGILTFLSKIWNLREMPSEDARFDNAYEDTHQHIVNNSDWTYEYLFLDRFKLVDGDENYFILFIETVVNPIVRKSKEEITYFVSKINSIVESSGYRLILTDYFEELPVYHFKYSKENKDLPIDIIANNIIIYLNPNGKSIKYPHFVLKYYDWDDYGCKTSFRITLQKDEANAVYIGRLKIMKRETTETLKVIPEQFTTLNNEYCSLGQEKEYYKNLKEHLGNNYYSFLHAMRDVAIYPKIYEQFERDNIFKSSLIRSNEIERLSRTVRFEIEGINPNEYFKFNYIYQPPYAKNTIALNFDFKYNTRFEHRIYAIIGKNGTGKTSLLATLAKNLSEKEPKNFNPRKPVYGKVFTVSYSLFDRFEIPHSDDSFNYVYCGLKKSNNSWKSEDEMLADFYKVVELIKEKDLVNNWYKILGNFIMPEILNRAFKERADFAYTGRYVFNDSKFEEVKKLLSSGQSIILYLISEILSQIRFDSLILFDEPETHLHPNAITALLNTLFNLVQEFKSFCIIATHSPLIIQEIPARNIFILEREEETAFVRELERESLGENLTLITQDIFGNRESTRHFISVIEELVRAKKTNDEIVAILKSDQLPLTSNIRLYIQALINSK